MSTIAPETARTIDRETLASAVQAQRYGGRMFPAENRQDFQVADRILALLQPDPRIAALEALCDEWGDTVGLRTENVRAIIRGEQ